MTPLAMFALARIPIRLIVYAAAIVFTLAIFQLKRSIYSLAANGKYPLARSLDRVFHHIPGYGHSLEGAILSAEGHYQEALEVLKPLAFDAQGHARLTSEELPVYATTLTNSGQAAAAQQVLEQAVIFAKTPGELHVALATSLLTQNKTPDRARQLMEEVLAIPPKPLPSYRQQTDRVLRIARYGWALARCGRRADAEAALRQAAESSANFKDRDLAGALYFMGETWSALGESQKARTAFEESHAVFPHGSSAQIATQALTTLNQLEPSR